MDLEFMRVHMRYPEAEYFDLFVRNTKRLIERHREAFAPEENEYLIAAHEEYRKTLQRQLEGIRKENRACDGALDAPVSGLNDFHKNLTKAARAQKAADVDCLISGIILFFTEATTGLKVSASRGAILPQYCEAVYTEIFGRRVVMKSQPKRRKAADSPKEPNEGPWINGIRKWLKQNRL